MQLGIHFPLVGATDSATTTLQPPTELGAQDASFDAAMSEGSSADGVLVGTLPATQNQQPPPTFSFVNFMQATTPDVDTSSEVLEGEVAKTATNKTTPQAVTPNLSQQEADVGVIAASGSVAKNEAIPNDAPQTNVPSQVPGISLSVVAQSVSSSQTHPDASAPNLPTDSRAVVIRDVATAKFRTETAQIANIAQGKTVGLPDGQPASPLMSTAALPPSNPSPAGLVKSGEGTLQDKFVRRPVNASSAEKSGTNAKIDAISAPVISKAQASGIGLNDLSIEQMSRETSGRQAPENIMTPMVSENGQHVAKPTETAYFTTTGQTPETSEFALLHDGVAQISTTQISADIPIEEQSLDIALTDVRATETQAARAEISGLNRTELPRHIALQLADAARTMPDRPVELTLSPEELGRLRLTFTGDLSAMAVSVNVERPETLELMRRHIETLAQEMRDMGYEEVTFSFEQSGADTGGNSSDEQPTSNGENNGGSPSGASPDINPAPVRLSMTGMSGVDIRL